jgi:hypothetical protein
VQVGDLLVSPLSVALLPHSAPPYLRHRGLSGAIFHSNLKAENFPTQRNSMCDETEYLSKTQFARLSQCTKATACNGLHASPRNPHSIRQGSKIRFSEAAASSDHEVRGKQS